MVPALTARDDARYRGVSFWHDTVPDDLTPRAPLAGDEDADVAIIGAGFCGLLTGARLRELGVQNIRLIDKAAVLWGNWYWTSYPGIACDVESYGYMALLE